MTSDTTMSRGLRGAMILLATAAMTACGGGDPGTMAADSTSTLVLGARDVAEARTRDVTAGVTITGSLDPAEAVDVKAQVAGQIARVVVDRGSRVRRGAPLALLERGTARAQVASAAAAVASAERDLEAADTLYKAGAVSERDYTQAKTALDAARAQLVQSRETLERNTIESPITGVVSDRLVSSGEAIRVGDRLFTVVNADTLELAGQVGADEIGDVHIGDRAVLRLESYPDRRIEGRVARIEPVANVETRQVGVYIHVPNRSGGLVAGLFATGTILSRDVAESGPVLAIPTSAVLQQPGGATVFAIEADTISRRQVLLGARDATAGLVSVRSGLEAGTLVIVRPGQELSSGTRVRIAADSAANDAETIAADTAKGGR